MGARKATMEISMSRKATMILGRGLDLKFLKRTNQRARFWLKPPYSEDDMELDAEVLLNLEQDMAMQEDVAAEGLNITS